MRRSSFDTVIWRIGLALALLLVARLLARGESPVPEPWPRARYAAMTVHSPFARTTAVPPAAAANSFAGNWFISGIGRINGEDFVSIKARDLSTQFSLYGREARDGVALASINWSDAVGRSTVILRKGTETAKLEFNEAEVRKAPQLVAATPMAAPAAIPPTTGAQSHPPQVHRRALPIPVPR